MLIRFRQSILTLFLATVLTDLPAVEKHTVMAPMRDGVRLSTDVFLPTLGDGPWPVILIRSPYNKASAMDDAVAALLTDIKRYALVVQDTRGRHASEGADSLYFSDSWGAKQDGYDTVEWAAAQPWSNGRIGTWGASALGITQYFLAGAAPPHLACCFIIVAASNLYEDALFYGGAYRRSLVDTWLRSNGSGHLINYFADHSSYEPLYDLVNLSTRYDQVDVPIFHAGGWHDIFVQGQINAFCGIQEHGGLGARGRQKLLIGPWTHNIALFSAGQLIFPRSGDVDLIAWMIEWFDFHLKDRANGVNALPPVQYYLMGDADQPAGPGNRWIETGTWPPPSEATAFYLRENGRLSTDPPDWNEPPDAFTYDPDDPVPTVGGRNLNLPAGAYDQRGVENRSDVLIYTSDPVQDSLTVAGRITVTLFASSDALDTDFTAKLSDVYPDGRSMLVADGIIQARHRKSLWREDFLTPGEVDTFEVDLWSTAIVFAPGHRIRLAVSSTNFPRFEANPNTGESFRKNTGTVIASQTIFHDAVRPSAFVLPVLEDVAPTPDAPVLVWNAPNPFNQETRITVNLPDGWWRNLTGDGLPSFEIFDLRGRRVMTWNFVPDWGRDIGLRWRGDDSRGQPLPSGVYIFRFSAGTLQKTAKITLVR